MLKKKKKTAHKISLSLFFFIIMADIRWPTWTLFNSMRTIKLYVYSMFDFPLLWVPTKLERWSFRFEVLVDGRNRVFLLEELLLLLVGVFTRLLWLVLLLLLVGIDRFSSSISAVVLVLCDGCCKREEGMELMGNGTICDSLFIVWFGTRVVFATAGDFDAANGG